VLCLPSQTPSLRERYGLTRAQTDSEAWVIELATGRRFSGAAAANRVLAEYGGAWAALASLYQNPLFAWLENRAYRWMAAHRGQLARFYSAVPECDQPGVECE
jgi:predicted DCC family thiol-disulfide oxidoreductase YuxK